jgi:hypothetical protein
VAAKAAAAVTTELSMVLSPIFFVNFHRILSREAPFRNDLSVFYDKISIFWLTTVALFFRFCYNNPVKAPCI